MAPLPLRVGLPVVLGEASAELQNLFSADLRAYSQRLRDRRGRPTGAKIINDPVWQTIRLESWEVAIVDSPVLQRLRAIHQLGLAYLVFPGAGYSRFEHSIGVLSQTQRFIESINRNARTQDPRSIDPVRPADEVALRLAALLHDIGHGFLSHVSERAMTRLPSFPSGASISDLILEAKTFFHCRKRPALAEVLAALVVLLPEFSELLEAAHAPEWAHSESLSDHVARFIVGSSTFSTRPFLSEIISGSVDADKLDYMARDCYMAGLPMPVDIERLLQKVLAVGVPAKGLPGEYASEYGLLPDQTVYVFAIEEPGGKTVEEMVVSRVLLYDKLYQHQKVRAMEGMVENALDLLNSQPSPFHRLSTYLALTDDEFLRGHWPKIDETAAVSTARQLINSVARRQTIGRCFVFGPSLLESPAAETRAGRQAWRTLKPLVSRTRTPEALEFRRRVVERARDYLRTDGQANLADQLSESDVVIDLPDVQGIAEKTRFWVGNEESGIELYSDRMRVERWAEAYENQKNVGYVFGPYEQAAAIYLAARDLMREAAEVSFDGRSLFLTKLSATRVAGLADRLLERGVRTATVVPVSGQGARASLRMDHGEILESYRLRVEELADRFHTFQGHEGTNVDPNRIVEWLAQFPRDYVRHAVRVLQNLRYWDRRGLVDAFTAGLEGLERQFGQGPEKAQYIALGGPTTSSRHVSYLWPDVRRALRVPLRVLDSIQDLEAEVPIVFYDDYVGSGGQAITVLQQWLGMPPDSWRVNEVHVSSLDESVLARVRSCPAYFLFATGRRRGLEELVGAARKYLGHDRIAGEIVHPWDHGCFRAASNVFPSSEDAEAARAAFDAAGRRALGDRQGVWPDTKIDERTLGYGNHAGLTVFYYNVPTSSLTALWKTNAQENSSWLALFPRRARE